MRKEDLQSLELMAEEERRYLEQEHRSRPAFVWAAILVAAALLALLAIRSFLR